MNKLARTIVAIFILVMASLYYRDLTEYRWPITLSVGVSVALLVLIAKPKDVSSIVRCCLFSALGIVMVCLPSTTPDVKTAYSGAILGWMLGVIGNALHRRAKATTSAEVTEDVE